MSSSYRENTDLVATLEANEVQYELLTNELNKFQAGTNNDSPGWTFQTTFEEEVRRVIKFVNDQQEGLERSAKALFLQANGDVSFVTSTGSQVQESHAMIHDLKQETSKTIDDCIALQRFFTISRTILMDHASRADSYESLRGVVNCTTVVTEIMPKAHINSSLVCIVSDTYHALRQAEEKLRNNNSSGGEEEVWQAPSSFQRVTTKYWVKDENLTKLMMTCAMEAPLLVYGKKGPLTSIEELEVSEGDKLWDTLATRITSIYFDTANMSLYKSRLARAEGAQLLRARWYGTTMPTGDKHIFLELKTHHEKWVNQKSVKERATIQERDMVAFLVPVHWKKEDAEQIILRAKPNMKVEEIPKAIDLLLRMHNGVIVKHKTITACVRSVYDRAAFQSAKSNDLRLTLDRSVTVVNERENQPPNTSTAGQWCLSDSEAQTAQAKVVPYNVFEVKLASDDPMPTGLAQAQNDSTMELATKFSKFTTGAAVFNSVPTLPYWAAHPAFYSFFELDKRCGPSSSESNDDGFQQADYNLMGASNEGVSGNILPKGVTIAPKYPARIEPKTYFANERTFVQWISASILLLNISGYLLSATNSNFNATAAVISFSAFVLVVYSTHLYFKRLNLLKVREPYGYFNKVNPIFLTSIVGLAIFLIWTDSIHGSDFLNCFSNSSEGRNDNRRSLQQCPQDVIGTHLMIKENPSSLVVDFKRNSFLMTSEESVYMQPMNDEGPPSKADFLIRINKSHLQGLATVGDQLFAVSDGPYRTELIEMAWWGPRDGNEKLRIVGRWTLEDGRSQVDGFSFVSSIDSTSEKGSFYINVNSSIRAYSVPVRSGNEEQDQLAHPMRLKSLNMKVLTQGGTAGDKASNDRLSTMATFEGITYFLRSKKNVLEAWNLTDGTLFSEIELPSNNEEVTKWTGIALERRVTTSTETSNLRGGDMSGLRPSGALYLHLMTDETASGGSVWSFPVLENIETSNGLFSFPDCQAATTLMS